MSASLSLPVSMMTGLLKPLLRKSFAGFAAIHVGQAHVQQHKVR